MNIIVFDTETTGLHITQDKPFLFQFGFLDEVHKIGYTYAVDIERQPILARAVIKEWRKLAKSFKYKSRFSFPSRYIEPSTYSAIIVFSFSYSTAFNNHFSFNV